MAYVVKDKVAVTTTSTGTGDLALGSAVSGYQDFSVIGDGNQTFYSITDGTNWETGVGTYRLDNWSVYFDGFGDRLTIPASSNFEFTGDFTVEAWMNFDTLTGSPKSLIGMKNSTVWFDIRYYSGNWQVSFNSAGGTNIAASPDPVVGTWCHVAVVRSGSTVSIYIDGVLGGSTTNSSTLGYSTIALGIGADAVGTNPLQGYISNLRIVKGTAVYTSAFTPPTTTLQAISGTVLLTCQNRTFTDNSNNHYTITKVGDTTAVNTTPLPSYLKQLSRDTVYSPSKINWGAGTKYVTVSYLADNTLGSVPEADNSSVGTDLASWYNLKKQMDRGVINGIPYKNNSTNGIVSTYSLVYTTADAYYGGVLAPNGDIHFIPFSAVSKGQKISSSGVVSTYSLVYTNDAAQVGGVLAPNGDIYFVPGFAFVGQKINSSGVVSTYSLVYTATYAYGGGVLAPDGSVHFAPNCASVGQKISSSGVVSTYSLIFTDYYAYGGGVLAPNGDIHFVPTSAPVGQKVSANGTVSTYSLVYTTTNAYAGGVLAPNGDIHFIPYGAKVGQKVDISGTVSTYSLVYTTSAGAYASGVLAPNGDIHFVPYSANRGQKISSAGVVSTYSLVYTTTSAYNGGILSPDGTIHFVPRNAVRGQSISTGVQTPIGYCLSPFFNKF